MYWLLLTLLAISSRAFYSLTTKMLTNRLRVSAGTQNFLITSTAMIYGLILSPILGGISFHGLSHYWLTITIMIVGASLGGITFLTGQKHVDASTAQIAFSSILLWGTVLSIIFLHSHFSLMQAAGIALLLVAIITVQYRKGKRHLDPGIIWLFVSAALFASFQVTSADLSKHISTGTYLLLAYGGPSLVVGLMYARSLRRDLSLLAKNFSYSLQTVLITAATSFGYYVFFYPAYHAAPDPGVVVVLITSQVVLSVLLGIVLLQERENVPRKLAAGALAFIAGVLIKVG
jgi:drug/metabolite transporter (DMT)-like permease